MPRLAWLLMVVVVACGEPRAVPDAAPEPADAAPPTGQGGEPRGDLAINEIVAQPDTGQDWLELVNRGAQAIDLSGWFVTDSPDRLDHYYVLPAGTSLAPGEYLVVWADDAATGAGHHAPFELGRADGAFVLTPQGLTADAVLFLAPEDARSLARVPDHEGLFFAVPASQGAANPQVLP